MAHRLARLLSPASIAVVGGREAEAVIDQCDRLGFPGEIWPVHRSRDEMAGRPCLRSVADLPAAPDAAFVAVPREATVEVVAALAALGTGGAVCYASGFAESGDQGIGYQSALVDAAGAMPVLGPNTYGLVNAADRVALWPDHHGCRAAERGVALVTQSSNIAMNLTMARPGVPVLCAVAVGNQADVDAAEAVEALLDDARIAAIGLHLEWLRDGVQFGRVATLALERGMPLVALRTGRSRAGAQLNRSHTAAIAGPDAAYGALFARYGVARVDTPAELAAALTLLAVGGPLAGHRVASLSCSGGEASLVADLGERSGLEFPPPTGDHRTAVAATLDPLVGVTNPLDYHTFGWGDRKALGATFGAMLAGPYDAGMLVLDYPDDSGGDGAAWRATAGALVDASQATATPGLVVASLPANLPDGAADELIGAGVAPVAGLSEAMAALRVAAFVGSAGRAPLPDRHEAPCGEAGELLDEAEAKQRFARAGIASPAGRVTGADGVVAAARDIGYPVAIKVLGITHKTERGAVVLGVDDDLAAEAAATRLTPLGPRLLVEAMVGHGVAELNVGIEPVAGLGMLMSLAAGGTLVEILEDAAHLLLPASEEDVAAALRSLRIWPVLDGYRGGPPADVESAVAAIGALAGLALAGEVVAVEVNPLLVMAKGAGAYALDGRLVMVAP